MALKPSVFDIANRALGARNKGFMNARGNTKLLKTKFIQNVNAGEKLTQPEFEMRFDGMPEMTTLVRSTQFPTIARNMIEDFCHGGGKTFSYGSRENSGEITVSVVETIEGRAVKHIRDAVNNGRYINVSFSAIPESTMGIPVSSLEMTMMYCVIRCDAIDFTTEDVSALVKPTLTINYNDIQFDDELGIVEAFEGKGTELIKRILSPTSIF